MAELWRSLSYSWHGQRVSRMQQSIGALRMRHGGPSSLVSNAIDGAAFSI